MASVFIKSLALGEIDQDAASCCIASSVSDYVTKAIRLASDDDYRARVARAIRVRADRIFNEKSVNYEWAKLLTRALGMRKSDDELKLLTGFVPEERHEEPYVSQAIEDEQLRWRRSVLLRNTLNTHK